MVYIDWILTGASNIVGDCPELMECMNKDTGMDSSENRACESRSLSQYWGKPWSSWITGQLNKLPDDIVRTSIPITTDSRVTRLPRHDMGLFGMCPESDVFSAIICSTCGAVVKPQGLKKHIELKHPADSQSFLLPPPQMPLRKSKPMNVKSKESVSTAPSLIHSSEPVTTPVLQPVISLKPVEASTTCPKGTLQATSPCKIPISSVHHDSDHVHGNNLPTRRKSPNTTNERKRSKEKEHEGDKSSALIDNSAAPNIRTLQVKPHITSSRRTITNRICKDLPKSMVVNSIKDQPTQISSGTSFKQKNMPSKMIMTVPDLCDANILSQISHKLPEPVAESSFSNIAGQSTEPLKRDSAPVQLVALTSSHPLTAIATEVSSPVQVSMFTSAMSKSPNSTFINAPVKIPVKIKAAPYISSVGVTEPHKVIMVTGPICAVKVSNSNPVFILSPKEPSLPAVNLNVNSESTNSKITLKRHIMRTNPTSVLKPRPVIVPERVKLPPLQEKITNITYYQNYPKPITVSTFSGHKIGSALIFSSKYQRLNHLRNQFKASLVKNKQARNRSNNVQLKTITVSPGTPGTLFATKALIPNNTCRFPKAISILPNVSATSLLTHRPNILRATLPKQTAQNQNGPKIIATGIKRPATSSPQLANLSDCKHLLLTPGSASAISGIISKMIVQPHQHEITELADSPTASHLALDKGVSVNIK